MKIVVAGCGGLIGKPLIEALEDKQHQVIRLVRPQSEGQAENERAWDPARGQLDPAILAGADVVITLSGSSIAVPWSPANQKVIRESRLQGTTLLSQTMAALEPEERPRAFLCATGIGVYGDSGDRVVDENTPPGEGWLAELCVDREHATKPARDAGVRTVYLRIGVVLEQSGGALAKMIPIFRMGVGGVVAGGRQYMSWISLQDIVGGIVHLAEHDTVEGAVNLVAPQPATNREFTKELAHALHRPAFMPVPAFAIRLLYGQMGVETILHSTRAIPRKLQESGYTFHHPTLPEALKAALS